MAGTHSIATTTAMLEAELPQLEDQQQALHQQLEQVTKRLESVRGALTALSALAGTTLPQPRTEAAALAETGPAPLEPDADTAPEPAPAAEPQQSDDAAVPVEKKAATPRRSTTRKASATPRGKTGTRTADEPARKTRASKKTSGAKGAKAAKTATVPQAPAAGTAQDTGGLTDEVIAVLASRADTPLRARDVAQALGRDGTTGSINTVRSTLDRLVATSRAHRAGRGLYQAPAS
ncbi:prefoldin domain-containing protein [Streptomyces peucetius]|nr:hypothetical protein CGZ69_34310 [Streptomyces peucetius subsp. caesius ATCC 27952]